MKLNVIADEYEERAAALENPDRKRCREQLSPEGALPAI
jgi:hypothetical protein